MVQGEAGTLAGLRERNEEAFADFVVRHGAAMRRIAAAITRDVQVAEEAVQETWLAVLRGLDRFEARSSLRTWVFRILINRARSIAAREARTVPFSSLALEDDVAELPAPTWQRSPEQQVLSSEMRGLIQRAVATLPAAQREVVTLRDIEGWSAEDVCGVLGLSDVNQRVLLHRARAKLRAALEDYWTSARLSDQASGGQRGS